ncbi:hypothetical protein C6501_05335 [Candidatus Poribacteria bacterium]|nr:MAG: hypothetical protein C6501_05335 [Candidatus Poribacteria bacterium]
MSDLALLSMTVAICVLSCLGCGSTTNSAKIYNDLGLAKVEMEQYEDAIADFDSAIEGKPDFAEAYYNRGKARIKLVEYKIATDPYGKIIQFKTIGELFELYYLPANKDFKKALKLAEQAGDTQLKAKIEAKLRSYREHPIQPNQILGVGDKLPYFSNSFPDDDKIVRKRNLDIMIDARISINGVVTGGTLTFSGVIELQNGKRYYAPEQCTINYPNGVIAKGKITVYDNN